MSSSGMAVPDLHNTFGATFIGSCTAMLMYGITTLQTYLYYMYYPNDPRDTKILVAIIWILDTLHIALMCRSIYFYLVSNFGNVVALAEGTCLGTVVLFSPNILSLSPRDPMASHGTNRSDGACSFRIWNRFVSLLHLFLLTARIAETVVFMFMKRQFKSLSQITVRANYGHQTMHSRYSAHFLWQYYAATPFAVTAVLSDIFVAGALCILLRGKRSPFFETNVLVNTLIIYAINRCLLTSLVAIIEVIVFAILPHSLWFLAIDFVIGKLYANSFLASLNSRGSLRDRERRRHDMESSMRINSTRETEWRVSAGGINSSRESREKHKHRDTTGTVATDL
ncbi:hypothetical protein J3A83DRAFT_1728184 [Scleroderma citrinum]